jgi:hypothetical protein
VNAQLLIRLKFGIKNAILITEAESLGVAREPVSGDSPVVVDSASYFTCYDLA